MSPILLPLILRCYVLQTPCYSTACYVLRAPSGTYATYTVTIVLRTMLTQYVSTEYGATDCVLAIADASRAAHHILRT
jgi:hypothetical protein